jgi:hypothetical protein
MSKIRSEKNPPKFPAKDYQTPADDQSDRQAGREMAEDDDFMNDEYEGELTPADEKFLNSLDELDFVDEEDGSDDEDIDDLMDDEDDLMSESFFEKIEKKTGLKFEELI